MLESAYKSTNAAIVALDLSTSGDLVDTLIELQDLVRPYIFPDNSPSIKLAYIYPIKKPLDFKLALSHSAFSSVCQHLENAKNSIIESGVESVMKSKEFAAIISVLEQVKLFNQRS